MRLIVLLAVAALISGRDCSAASASSSSHAGLAGGIASGEAGQLSSRWYGVYASYSPVPSSTPIPVTALVTDLEGTPSGHAVFLLNDVPILTNALVVSDAVHPITSATVPDATASVSVSIGPLAAGDYALAADLVSTNRSFPNTRVHRTIRVRDISPLDFVINQHPNPAVSGESVLMEVLAVGFLPEMGPPTVVLEGGWKDPQDPRPSALEPVGTMIRGELRILGSALPHRLTAFLRWDPQYSEAYASRTVIVQDRESNLPSSLTVQVSPPQPDLGESVTIVCSVSSSSGAPMPTGYCALTLNQQLSRYRGLATNGIATFHTTALALGTNTISVDYSGDTRFINGTSSPFTVVVRPPRLKTTTTNGLIRVRWPVGAPGFVLESSSSPSDPNSWIPTTDQGDDATNRIFDTPPIAGSDMRVFRLRKLGN